MRLREAHKGCQRFPSVEGGTQGKWETMNRTLRTVALIGYVILLGGLVHSQPAEKAVPTKLPPSAAKKVDFKRDIAPIFKEKCLSCHGPDKQMGGLRLDSRGAALAGGYSGSVIKPGNSARSKLIHLVAGLEKDLVMPLTGERLTYEQVGLLRAWIDQGAAWDEEIASSEKDGTGETIRRKDTHWAFIPPQRPLLPQVRNRAWVRNPIDAFVLAKLEAEAVEPSPETDRITLIRRASLDLIGLPPTPDEVDQFLADKTPGAYARVVDRLLASPHYGEKWALHWLDLARFGESDGYQADEVRPYAWRWRHWVIKALNRNMPFDQFTLEQIAGDQLPHATLEQKVATGFHRNTLSNRETGFPLEMDRVERIIDRTETFGTVWLGLTVGCARCHDHKFDPITQKEFYQLYAFFNTASEVNLEAPLPGEMGPYLQGKAEHDRKWRELIEEYNAEKHLNWWETNTRKGCDYNPKDPKIDLKWNVVCEQLLFEIDGGVEILKTPRSQRTQKDQEILTYYLIERGIPRAMGAKQSKEAKLDELLKKLDELDIAYPHLTEAYTVADNPNPPKTHILIRGNFRRPGIEVESATPTFLPSSPPQQGKPSRLTLARWLGSHNNPLTARVTVNRWWQELFGRGLVETSEDFGTRGDRPTHPKLLDWLAVEFMESGWNIKETQKLIVTSATYRQSSKTRKDLQSRDPRNKLLARQLRLRLPAELVRDVTLAASGLLNPAIGGESIRPSLPPGMTEFGYKNKWPESMGADRYRRGVYVFRQRTWLYPQLVTFDAPDTLTSRCRRERSTNPLQALTLLNDPVFVEAAQGLAARILRERPGSVSDRIDYAFKLCLARAPSPREKDLMAKYYQQQKERLKRDPKSAHELFPATNVEGVDTAEAVAWMGVSSVLLNLDESITRE